MGHGGAKNACVHAGEFREGERWGTGRDVGLDKTVYVGDFKDGVRDGWGTATYADASVYRGFWR